MTIWGNHSATQYPGPASRHGRPASPRSRCVDEAWYREKFIPVVQQRGAAIIKARGASSAASAASSAIDHVRDWVLGTPEGDWVQMARAVGRQLRHPGRRHLRLSGDLRNGRYEIVQGLAINEFSRARMDATHRELLEERDGVRELL